MFEREVTAVTCDNAVWVEGLDGNPILLSRLERGERLLAEIHAATPVYVGRHRVKS